MGAFEEVFIKAKEVAETAEKKTSNLVESTKLKMESAEIKKDIDAVFEGIGRLVYNGRKTGEDVSSLVDDCIAQVDGLQERREKIEERICEFKNAIRCKKCGTMNTEDAIYCKKCGDKIKA